MSLGLGLVRDGDLEDLVIAVEHIEREAIPRLVEQRPPKANEEFFGLFLRMAAGGRMPLDYKFNNVKFNPRTGEVRPVDVMVVEYRELAEAEKSNPGLMKLRMMQLAHTAIEINRMLTKIDRTALSSSLPESLCREIVREMGDRFPQHREHIPKLRQQLGL